MTAKLTDFFLCRHGRQKGPSLTQEAPSRLSTDRLTLDARACGIGGTCPVPANREGRDRRLQYADAVFRHRRFAPVDAQSKAYPAGRPDCWDRARAAGSWLAATRLAAPAERKQRWCQAGFA